MKWLDSLLVWAVRNQPLPSRLPPPMQITSDHWLESATRRTIAGGAPLLIRRFLVIHHTAGATGASSIDYWQEQGKGICAHIVIERDGAIFQCRPFNRTCGHAGSSKWKDPETGIMHIGLNSCSIGIELANAGDSFPALGWARKQPGFQSVRARHKNGGDYREWESYPLDQLQACEEVSKALVARYRLDDVLGHEDCSPSRKVDPGPAYPMQALRNACGFLEPLGKLT